MIMDRLDEWSTESPGDAASASGKPSASNEKSPAQTLKASNLLPFVLQSLVTLILLFLFIGAAFGPLSDPDQRSHKAFVEHVEAIGKQYARTGQPGLTYAAQALAKLLVMRHRDRLRGGTSGGWAALAQELSEKHNVPVETVKAALRLGMDGVTELGTPVPRRPQTIEPIHAAKRCRVCWPFAVKNSLNHRNPASYGFGRRKAFGPRRTESDVRAS